MRAAQQSVRSGRSRCFGSGIHQIRARKAGKRQIDGLRQVTFEYAKIYGAFVEEGAGGGSGLWKPAMGRCRYAKR